MGRAQDKVFTLSFFLSVLLIGFRGDIEKVPFWLKPSNLLVAIMPFGGKKYVTNIVTGKAVQWASCGNYITFHGI